MARSTAVARTGIWTAFYFFILLDFLLIWFFGSFRISSQEQGPAQRNIGFVPFDPNYFTQIWVILAIFLQFGIIYFGFLWKASKEPKYEIFPTDNSPGILYHYFTVDQLVAFIDSIAASVSTKPVKYDKIFVLRNPVSRLFSYSGFGKKIVVLDPAMLQIAQTHELRAFLAQNMMLISTRLSLIRMVHSQSQFFWYVIIIPPIYTILKEIFQIAPIGPVPLNLLHFTQVIFLFIVFIISVFMLKPLHLRILNNANDRVMMISDLLAADIVGKRAMINMLVKQGQRSEVLAVLLEEFRWLEQLSKGRLYDFEEYRLLEYVQKFPIDQLDAQLAKEMASLIYLRDQMLTLQKIYNCEILEMEYTLQRAQEKLKEKRKLYLDDVKKRFDEKKLDRIPEDARISLKTNLMDWKHIDVDRDTILNEDEIKILTDALQRKKKKGQGNVFAYELAPGVISGVESRILNIYKNVDE